MRGNRGVKSTVNLEIQQNGLRGKSTSRKSHFTGFEGEFEFSGNMATVSVHALNAGSLTLDERFFISPSDHHARRTVPSLSFLVQHRDAKTDKITRLVFDLGLRRDIKLYPAVLQKHCEGRQPLSTQPDVVASLASGGLGVKDIDYVMFSHVHYDHVGMPKDFDSPKTTFLVGSGALGLLSGKTTLDIGSHSFFEADLLPPERTSELPNPSNSSNTSQHKWKPLHPFPNVIDFFGDGSVYIVDAPGHLPGHINLMCRISRSKFVILAGDACHDVRLFTGERDIATWTDNHGKYCCIHADVPAAKETIARLREVGYNGIQIDGETEKAEVEVIFAHNADWEAAAKKQNRFWPGKL